MSGVDGASMAGKMSKDDAFVLTSLEAMRKKLLDLTSRNRLLNFPITNKGSSLRIVDELPDQLYQTLCTEDAMSFAPVPDPTRQQLLDYGYLGVGPDGRDVEIKKFPNAKEWAHQLGICTDFDLPSQSQRAEVGEATCALLERTHGFIHRYATEQGGKLTGIRAQYAKHNINLSELVAACRQAGYESLEDFERQAKMGKAVLQTLSHPHHQDNQIQVLSFPSELEARLRDLHNKAQTAIEESGANILYLALGFLEWFESDTSDKARLAPLFTIPVRFERGKLDIKEGIYKYQLFYTGEDILTNLSLKEKLQADFGLALPDFDDDQSPENYFSAVARVIGQHKSKWSVKRYGALSLLNFGKMMMFLDLDPENWPKDKRNIVSHEVIRRFFTSQQGGDDTSASMAGLSGQEYCIDSYQDIHNKVPLIDDADSSQHSALIDAIHGKNLVIEGPPGSGKSQTITNLIAAALLNGKKVLFVAEKMAALEVVKRRLTRAGLGDFCLELHSHKTHKRKVLEDIQARMMLQMDMPTAEDIDAQIVRYEELKQQLNDYALLVNRTWGQTGKSIHQILSGAARYRQKLDIDATTLHIDNVSGQTLDAITQLRLSDQVVEFGRIYKEVREQIGAVAEIYEHPWSGVNNTQIQLFDSDRIVDALHSWTNSIHGFQNAFRTFWHDWALVDDAPDLLVHIEAMIHDVAQLPALTGHELFEALPQLDTQESIDCVRRYLTEFTQLQNYYDTLNQAIVPERIRLLEQGFVHELPSSELVKYGIAEHFSIHDLIKWLTSFHKNSDELTSLYEQLSDFKNALPVNISSHIDETRTGLIFCSELLSIVRALPVELIRLRGPLFDEDDFDALLLELSQQLDALRSLRERLSITYHLDRLPPQEQLEQAVAVIQQGGIFSWIKSEWRNAKALLQGLSCQPNTKFSELKNGLVQLLEYTKLLQAFEQRGFDHELGAAFRGLDTDCEPLLQVRSWYKRVRACYGIGFGPKVSVGSAVISLDAEIIKGIHQLETAHISVRISALVKQLESDALSLPFFAEKLKSQPWLGVSGVLQQAGKQVQETLTTLQEWFINDEVSLVQMTRFSTILEEMATLQASLKKDKSSLGIFSLSAPLEIGVDKQNKAALAIVNDTLNLASLLLESVKDRALSDRIRRFCDANEYGEFCRDWAEIAAKWKVQLQFAALFSKEVDLDNALWFKSTNGTLDSLIERNQRAIEQPRWLNGWVNFIRSHEQMRAYGLQRIWDAVLSGKLPIENVDLGLSLALFDQLAREVIRVHPELVRISGSQRNALRKTFKDYDKKLIQLQRQRIAAKITQRHIPEGVSGGKKSAYTDLALIQNELGKKTRHIPIRQLVNRASSALVAIKPCFMMGPLSVAHYLKPGLIDFDLVVMDEASQVKPEDALGVIARGKQLVVVGDPKQLPPTSFFDRSVDAEDDEDAAALSETDSILDAALPLFPMRRLRWHYRSQHEKLIAYSNRHFYNNDLVIFPSPYAESPEFGIKFTYVAKGRFSNQHNIEEAQAVAEAVLHHAVTRPGESLGVVAMSSKQRDQIERAIDELRRSQPDADSAIDKMYAMDEPLFIKNLENVQGDERDVIFISFTYGPAEHGGKVYQRFGPVNSDVGWRRLNVLFTRSKKRMHVFSSMRSDDVLTSESSKRGVLSLKGFLQFAQKGYLDAETRHTGKGPDSDFEIAVMEALAREGFECEPQVGVAGFFIDLAVKDPGCNGRYLMGIECDGATYHSAKSARDRDRLRQEVLERLGWQISRIWSTDWFSNPDEVLSPIIRKLNELKTLEPEVDKASSAHMDEQHVSFDENDVQEKLPAEEMGLREQLRHFTKHVIEPTLPNVDDDHRLLRPAMLEALLEHQPLSRSEFVERIPQYLRQATDKNEAYQFLDQVLSIIDGVDTAYDITFDSEFA